MGAIKKSIFTYGSYTKEQVLQAARENHVYNLTQKYKIKQEI